jgi:hypothetical protein
MAVLTVHHWNDLASGLIELRRVVTGAIAVVCWDAQVFNRYWMVAEYLPESRALDTHVPSPTVIADILGGGHVEVLPVPADCADGFYAAWWRRPEAYLDPAVRAGISGIARLPADRVQPAIDELRSDLASGRWLRKHGHLLQLDAFDAGYRLVVATPQAP